MNDIGKLLKMRRLELEMTQEDLSKKSGVSTVTIHNYEKSKGISLDTLKKICSVLCMKLTYNIEKL